MAADMVRKLIEEREAEGRSEAEIRAELAQLGFKTADSDRLLEEPPNVEEIMFYVQLAPVVLVPLIVLVLACVLDRPQFAVGMAVAGFTAYVIAWFGLMATAFMIDLFWVIIVALVPLGMPFFILLNFEKTWKWLLVYILGVAMFIGACFIDGQAVIDSLPQRSAKQSR